MVDIKEQIEKCHQQALELSGYKHKEPERSISIARFDKKRGRDVMLPPEVRQHHMLVTGLPGSGKSKFLEYPIRQDILAGHGGIVIDPTGNLYNDLVRWIVEKGFLKRKNIILFDPTLSDYAIGYNPLSYVRDPADDEQTVEAKINDLLDSVISAFSSMMGDEDAEGMPLYLRVITSIIYVLAEKGLTLNEAQHLISHAGRYREFLTENSNHPIIRANWKEFNELNARDFAQWFMAPANRIGRFLMSPTIRDMVGQRENAVNLLEAMDQGKFILVNLSKSPGFTKTDAILLGRMILNDMANKSYERKRTFGKEPKPFYCYIDESYRYLNQDIADSLERLRQNGLRMILVNQQLGQMEEMGPRIYGAVTGSAQIKVYFRMSSDDAERVIPHVAAGKVDYEMWKENLTTPTTVGHHFEEMVDTTRGSGKGEGEAGASGHGSTEGASLALATPQTELFGSSNAVSTLVTGDSNAKTWMDSVVKSSFWSETESETRRQALIPDMAWIPAKEYSLEEQKNKIKDKLMLLENRKAIYCLPGKVSYEIITHDLPSAAVNDERLEHAKISYAKQHIELYTLRKKLKQEFDARLDELDRLYQNATTEQFSNRGDEDTPDDGF